MKVKMLIGSGLVMFGLAASCATAQADEVAGVFEPATKSVNYSDLNLRSDKGAEVFYGRVKSAARVVCTQYDNKELALTDKWQTCYNHAIASAVEKVNEAKVTALYDASTKSRAPTRLASNR